MQVVVLFAPRSAAIEERQLRGSRALAFLLAKPLSGIKNPVAIGLLMYFEPFFFFDALLSFALALGSRESAPETLGATEPQGLCWCNLRQPWRAQHARKGGKLTSLQTTKARLAWADLIIMDLVRMF
jgi:hypothetical protein